MQMRLDKLLASTGRWSRREVKELVRRGRVLVDGAAPKSAEEKVEGESAHIRVDGEEILYSATSGLIPVCIMGVSALVMVVCGVLMKLPKMKWLSEYALPISLIVGMASAIPFTGWLS